jgi:RNA polymerase sigma factor (sigma-70 family)
MSPVRDSSSKRSTTAADATSSQVWDTLMAAAQDGNAVAYHRLLSEIDGWLHRYYAKRLPVSMIDDAVQEALVAVHRKRHMYDPRRPFAPWLAAIARYKWIDAIRSSTAKATVTLEDDVPTPGHEDAITSARSLDALLRSLNPAQAQVIRLVRLQGHSIKEASKATGQSTALVKVNIHRGLKRLAVLLRNDS